MTNSRYAITYTGTGIVRLPRAGIFQTGTRAVVDETVARIAVAHGTFMVVPIDAATPIAMPVQAAPIVAAPPMEDKGRRPTRRSQAIRAVR